MIVNGKHVRVRFSDRKRNGEGVLLQRTHCGSYWVSSILSDEGDLLEVRAEYCQVIGLGESKVPEQN